MTNYSELYNVYAGLKTFSIPETAVLIGIIAVISACVHYMVRHRRLPLPPGPKPLPLLGNILDMPRSRDYEAYAKWQKAYGDIVHVEALGKHIVVINSVEIANDLLERRSAIYSDRPYLPMIYEAELMDMDWALSVKRDTSSWRRGHRLFAQHLSSQTAEKSFSLRQALSVNTLLRSLLHSPNELDESIKHMIGGFLLKQAYGFDIQPTNDPYVELVNKFSIEAGQGLIPTKFLVNLIPWLRYLPSWFPGNNFTIYAKRIRAIAKDLIRLPYERYKRELTSGNASDCFLSSALGEVNEMSDPELFDDVIKVAATVYGAGADTIESTLRYCILALVLNQDIQRRAHKDLDAVLGSPDKDSFRLPSFDDRPRLPYIDALVKESLRWMPVLATGVPHASTEEAEYGGYRIPKGSIMVPNAWAMLHDERVYKDPFTFRPDRFLANEDKRAEPDPTTRGPFGFGRRACPGRDIAYSLLWITIANLLAAFDFAPPRNNEGKDIDISYAAVPDGTFVLQGPRYTCSISPRSQYTKARILETEY